MKQIRYIFITSVVIGHINLIQTEEKALLRVPEVHYSEKIHVSKEERMKAIENDPLLGSPSHHSPPKSKVNPLDHLKDDDFLESPSHTTKSVHLSDSTSSPDEDLLGTPKQHSVVSAKDSVKALADAVTKDANNTTDHIQAIEAALKGLPEANKPKDMQQALDFVKQGQKAWKALEAGRAYDAVIDNLDSKALQSPHSTRDMHILKASFNTSDDEFWNLVQNNPEMKKYMMEKAAKFKIPFTKESFASKEHNMYFRAKYARKMTSDPAFVKQYQIAYEKAIVQVQWHLYARSIIQENRPVPGSEDKASAFTSGMITVHDPEHRLFQFLDGYSELASPHYKSHDAISAYSMLQTKAYPRKSSHYGGQKQSFGPSSQDFGIDIQGSDNQPLTILPGNKSHLLFGVRENGMTFVKWENYGVTFNPLEGDYSVVPHTMGYFEKHGKEDNPAYHMREAIPKAISDEFAKIYGKALDPAMQKYIDTYGISGMLESLKQSAPSRFEAFKDYLVKTKGYQRNTLHMRKGGEVVLQS